MKVLVADGGAEIHPRMQGSIDGILDGWEIESVGTGRAAVTALAEGSFDAVITDLELTGMEGVELLQLVSIHHPDTVRIAISEHPEQDAALRASAVAHDFALKCCDGLDLVRMVQHSCDLHGMIRSEKIRDLARKLGELPVQPELYSELMVAIGDPEVGMAEIGDIIERDVAVSAKLLRVANSPRFPLRNEVRTIQHAVSFMGARMVAGLVLSLEAAASFSLDRGSSFSLEQFNDHASFVGVLAREMFEGDKVKGDDAFVAGMMHDVGKLMMAARLPHQKQLVDAPGSELTHGMLGAYLLSSWGFRYPVVQGVAFHHQPELADGEFGIATALHVADAIAHEAAGEAVAEELVDMDHLEMLGVVDSLEEWKGLAAELI